MIDYSHKRILLKQNRPGKKRLWQRIDLGLAVRRLSVMVAVLAMIAGAAIWGKDAYRMSRKVFELKLGTVEITGTRILRKEALAQESGISSETNPFSVDLARVKENIKKNPYVKDVEVIRSLPEKIAINVVERRPVAILGGDGLMYLDEDGNAFKAPDRRPEENMDYPVITGIPADDGTNGQLRAGLVAQSLRIIREIVERKIARIEDISEVNFCEIYGFSVYWVGKPLRVIFGLKDIEEKFSRLTEIFSRLNNSQGVVSVIDLDYRDRAVVRLKGTI